MLKNEAHVDDSAGMPPLNWSQQFFLLQKKKTVKCVLCFMETYSYLLILKMFLKANCYPLSNFFSVHRMCYNLLKKPAVGLYFKIWPLHANLNISD